VFAKRSSARRGLRIIVEAAQSAMWSDHSRGDGLRAEGMRVGCENGKEMRKRSLVTHLGGEGHGIDAESTG